MPRGEEAAEEERDRHDHEVHDADALVVLGQQPRGHAVLVVQIGDRRCSDERSSYGLPWSYLFSCAAAADSVCPAGALSDLMYSMSAHHASLR